LSLAGFGGDGQFFAFDFEASHERFGFGARNFGVHFSAELGVEQSPVPVRFEFGLRGVGLELRFQSLLIEKLRLELDAEIGKFGLGFLHGELSVRDLTIQIGIAELENDGVGSHMGAGAQKDLVDMAIGARGKPANVFGDKSAQTIHATNHGTGFDDGKLERGFVDGRRSGAKAEDAKRDGHAGAEDQYRECPTQKDGAGPNTSHTDLQE